MNRLNLTREFEFLGTLGEASKKEVLGADQKLVTKARMTEMQNSLIIEKLLTSVNKDLKLNENKELIDPKNAIFSLEKINKLVNTLIFDIKKAANLR